MDICVLTYREFCFNGVHWKISGIASNSSQLISKLLHSVNKVIGQESDCICACSIETHEVALRDKGLGLIVVSELRVLDLGDRMRVDQE